MFQLRQEQFAELRRKKIGDGLIATFAETKTSARWSEQKKYIIASDPLEHQTRFGFDDQGFIAAVASPLGRLWQIANYPDGKAAILKNPAGHELSITYTPAGQINTISSNGAPRLQLHYDESGQSVAASFPDGTFSAVEYTPWRTPCITTNRLGLRDVCEYDENRRLTALTDGNGNKTAFFYDKWNRPDSTIYPNETAEYYGYNKDGFVTKIATNETAVNLEPDGKGRPTILLYSDGDQISYKYDDKGRVVEASYTNGTSESPYVCLFAWGDSGLLESEQSGDDSIRYEYDKAGRLISVTGITGEKIEYEWDADSRLTLVRDWARGEHRIEYAANDRGNALNSPNGLSTLTLLNNVGRPENIAVSGQGKTLFSLGFVYDNEDRVTSIRDSAFGYRDFRYDPEGQLLAADSQGEIPNESFVFDGAGNPISINGTHAGFDPANQVLSLGHSRYDHDLRGNLLCMDTAKGLWRFSWNARNLLIRAESPTGIVTTYTYDAFGRRTRKQREGHTVEFFWAGEQLIAEIITAAETAIRYDYLYYPGSYTPLAVRVDGEIYSYHCDHLGSPRMISAPDGSTVWLAGYSSFGFARVNHGTFRSPLRAPGQYFDEETGLHYNRFRYYSPELGRYLSRDPLGLLVELNFYRFAKNNPINNSDPLGLGPLGPIVPRPAPALASVAVPSTPVVTAPTPSSPPAISGGEPAAAAASGQLNPVLSQQVTQSCVPAVPSSPAPATLVSPLPSLTAATAPSGAGNSITAKPVAPAPPTGLKGT